MKIENLFFRVFSMNVQAYGRKFFVNFLAIALILHCKRHII